MDNYEYLNVAESKVCEGEEEGTTFVQMQIGNEAVDYDLREAVFYIFAENKCPIVMMQLKKISLEEVFMELTTAEKEEQSEYSESREAIAQEAERLVNGSDQEAEEQEDED